MKCPVCGGSCGPFMCSKNAIVNDEEPDNAQKIRLPPMRVYRILSEAVDCGILRGFNRAHKHTDTPSPEAIQEAIHSAVMGEIVEIFNFDEPESS